MTKTQSAKTCFLVLVTPQKCTEAPSHGHTLLMAPILDSASAHLWLWLGEPGRVAPAAFSLSARELAGLVAGLGIELSAPSVGGLCLCPLPAQGPSRLGSSAWLLTGPD